MNPYKFDIYSLGMSIAKLIIEKEDRYEMEQAYIKARKQKSVGFLRENVDLLQQALVKQLNLTTNPEEKKFIYTIKNMTSFNHEERPSIYEIALSHTHIIDDYNLKLILSYQEKIKYEFKKMSLDFS